MHKLKVCILFLFSILPFASFAQADKAIVIDKQLELLQQAIEPLSDSSVAIYFNRVAYALDNPTDIFTKDKSQVYSNCYYICKGNKFEINLGEFQSMSDGKVMIVINPISGQIYIDSMRTENPIDKTQQGTPMDLIQMMNDEVGETEIVYVADETINGIACKKFKSSFSKSKDFMLFWVDVNKKSLVMMADCQENLYNVYWIREANKVSDKHEFVVNLPDYQLETMYGYTVFDMRFEDAMLHKTIKEQLQTSSKK